MAIERVACDGGPGERNCLTAGATAFSTFMKPLFCVIAGAAFLSGCDRDPEIRPQSSAPSVRVILMSQVDLGASLLAEVENARMAIQGRDSVAASNDIAQALLFTTQLLQRPSTLIGSKAIGDRQRWGSGRQATEIDHVALTEFGVLVELNSAQAELPADFEAADAHLRNIQDSIPEQFIPLDLLLLRAAASLDLAQNAASSGRTADLMTQLLSAQLALSNYRGPGHVVEAQAMAATIGESLAQPLSVEAMLPYQPGSWLASVVKWAGADRWNAPIR